MGEYELKKFETESETKIGVLSGRSNFISTYFAVKDSPIIGHGSWAKDYSGYGLKTAYLIDDYSKINYYRNRSDPGWIPGHSHIFTAYIWHGILGALFWIYVLIILWGTFRYYMGNIPELFAYFAIALPNLFWAILFSPFGGRVTVVMVIVLSVLVRHQEYSPNQDIY